MSPEVFDKSAVEKSLRAVVDPSTRKDVVTLGMVKHIAVFEGAIRIVLELSPHAASLQDQLRNTVDRAVRQAAAVAHAKIDTLEIEFSAPKVAAPTQPAAATAQDQASNPLPNVKKIIAVGAGKGGVGKSTVAVNVAVGLARMGYAVGLLDADIYGPSAPTMLGMDEVGTRAKGQMLLPFELHGIKAMTIGKLVDPDKALVWRGPMAHGAFKQLATQTEWGELDYLIIDLPPGTGDVALTMAQMLPVAGAVVVCTPQRVAQDDARRAVRMFQNLGVEVLGVVENMSFFTAPDGKEYDLFGRGGAEIMAQTMGLPFLGSIPIHIALRENSDGGQPLANWKNTTMGASLDALCQRIEAQVKLAAMAGRTDRPTLTISP